jgi:predicted  nucleic acid-binding Zn-ribbon protein
LHAVNVLHETLGKEKTVDLLLPMLLSLQQLDDKLSAFGHKRREIPERIQAMKDAFEQEKRRLEDHKQRLKDAALKQRQLEKQLQESAEERKNKQKKLLEVKTNEEYKALLKEIEYAKEADSATEDEILAVFEEIDTLEKTLEDREKSTREREGTLKEETLRLEREVVEVDKEHRLLQGERQRVAEELDPAVLDDYEKIRERRAGQAVVTVQKEVCPGCHMHVPPQTINEVLQTGEIRHCPFCRRILYCELEETV